MASKTASHPVISLGLIPDGITKGLNAARNILNTGMKTLAAPFKTPLFGVALANQAAEFGQKINRLFLEPFRQLMAQEDLFSRFSVLAGGTDKAGKALDQFKGISRQTGISLTELSTSLDTLLQGQFSFAGAVAQIDDLSKVASVLGEGSLPMLTQAAAKFRSNAFVGFEDINQVAASGLPIFEALAQQIGITADEARGLARNGMITGLQARNALNGAAAMGAGANGGQQEQTLSGVVSRLREGLNQTLAEIGKTVSQVIDVPALLNRFRGFLEVVRTLLETAFGPLKNVIGADGGNLKQAFIAAQSASIQALTKIGEGFFTFLAGLEKVTNALIQLLGSIIRLSDVLGAKFTAAQEKQIEEFQKANQVRVVVPQVGPQMIPLQRDKAIEMMRKQGLLPDGGDLGPVNFGVNQVKGQFADLMKDVAKNLGKPNAAAEEQARVLARQTENYNQAKGALETFSFQFEHAFDSPLEDAAKKLANFDTLVNQAMLQGVAGPEILAQQAAMGEAAIGKGIIDFANQQAKVLQDARTNAVSATGSAALVESIGKAQIGGQVQADVQNRIAQSLELQKQIQEETKRASIEAVGFLRQIANQPKGNPIGKI